jgi:hypothetical protein
MLFNYGGLKTQSFRQLLRLKRFPSVRIPPFRQAFGYFSIVLPRIVADSDR